jgi:hypothetical protein
MSASTESRQLRILAYGIRTKGLLVPLLRNIVSTKYTIEFAEPDEAERFQNFDGVIVFQGAFESFTSGNDGYRSYLKHSWNRDELDKRTKETRALLEKSGIVCMLLTDGFIEFDNHREFRETDLSKRLLASSQINQFGLGTRIATVRSKINELGRFFELYGAAWSAFTPRPGDRLCKTLASAGNHIVSVVIGGNLFVIPTLMPKAADDAVEEYFTILMDGVVTVWERLTEDLPEWANEYRFPDEAMMLETKLILSNQISEVEARLKCCERLKRVLVLQGEPLVEAVMEVIETLPLKPNREESFKEDLSLVNTDGKTVALVEVKGVSKGVTREHVNQADSHRERNGMPPEFPSLLVVNTNMKHSMSVVDKDQMIASEQVQHACRNNVLLLRTLDLLNLVSLHLSGKVTSDDVVKLLTKSRGWLKVGETAEVLSS